jgi:hypothetical protein
MAAPPGRGALAGQAVHSLLPRTLGAFTVEILQSDGDLSTRHAPRLVYSLTASDRAFCLSRILSGHRLLM